MAARLQVGERVRFTGSFLRNIGMYTGPDAPTSYGPWARGEVVELAPGGLPATYAAIQWDDDTQTNALAACLEVCR